jgi:hypothetical protein
MCRWSRLILVVLIASFTLLYPLLAPPAHRIDKAHFAMIRPGMTRAEVESIFGVPSGEYDWAEAQGASWVFLFSGSTLRQAVVDLDGDVGVDVVVAKSAHQKVVHDLCDGPLDLFLNSPMLKNGDGSWAEVTAQVWPPRGGVIETWTSRHGHFGVWFDTEGRVLLMSAPEEAKVIPPWERVRRWKK